jgi:hypothetical protein
VEEAYQQLADAFAHSILRLDFSAAHKMLVKVDGEYRIGYFEFEDPD